MNKKIQRLLQMIPIKVTVLAVLFFGALFLFAFTAHEALYEREEAFDTAVHQFLVSHSTPALVQAAERFTFLGSSLFLLPAYVLLLGILVIFQKKRTALDIGLVALSSFLVMQLLKLVFRRQRPDLPIIKDFHTYSFPSGHALSAFVFCSMLAYLVWQARLGAVWKWMLTAVLFLLAVAISLSRIVLGVHFATDVIAGFCLGVMWSTFALWIIEKINHRRLMQD